MQACVAAHASSRRGDPPAASTSPACGDGLSHPRLAGTALPSTLRPRSSWPDEAGVDRTYVSALERGVYNATIVMVAKLAKALDVEPSALLQRKASFRARKG